MQPIVTIPLITERSLTVEWQTYDVDSLICGPVTYHAHVILDGRLIKQVTKGNLIHKFTGLFPNTGYTISVYGSNEAGDGPAGTKNVTTLANGKFVFCM